MKYNRTLMIAVLLLSVVILGGCMDVKDLSEEESDMVAEYSAGILLRYTGNYARRLITKEQIAREQGTDAAIPPEGTDPEPTPTPVPTEGTTSGAGSSVSGGDGQSVVITDFTVSGGGVQGEEAPATPVSLNDLYHIQGLDFAYKSYEFCSQYPKKSGSIAPAMARRDQTLLVVTFRVRNKGGAAKKVNLGKRKGISYTLTVDGSEYQPGITILENMGLNYLNTTIKKGGTEEAVLVFTMSKERRKASGISLRIREGDKATEISLKNGE